MIPKTDDFIDDKPMFHDWQAQPARSWRSEEPAKLSPGEVAKLGLIGVGMFIFGVAILIVAMVYL